MFILRLKTVSNIKRIFLITLLSLICTGLSFSQDFPEKLSKNAKISILSVNYTDLPHSLFSKSCLRIFDKETQFDKIIDFAHFEDFNDTFFGLKFLIKNKKAEIRSVDFLNYFLEQNKLTNVSLTESSLQLRQEEVAYIYNFLFILHKALPNYSYDFDILTNNSETHISQLLHDCYRMTGKKSTTERYSFSGITKHKLGYKKINGSFVLLSEKENLDFTTQDLTELFSPSQKNLIILLTVISSLFFLVTAYQVLVYFFEKLYIVSFYKSIQIFDFTILFSSGLSGFLIIFMNLCSDQAILQNNFEFLYLFPLNVLAAFSVFKPLLPRKIQITYWTGVSVLSLIYIAIVWIQESKLPIVNLLFVLPLLFRTLYFDFLAIDFYSIALKKALASKTSAK
ncbi:MAG: DUF4105 domain-containing protein [Treponema sp.]|uniref:lipoprotein N-acyltransferase Lnb domain-containing protein n=1 Tax=Treponema sp. TaxID=166 RepID=UPI0025FC84C4|nr:DUF4105 domain-containing protein [Treponema sp.]MBR0494795.1 DUF4105 domain-containing protein [Treponema sp.]